jgi:hypothetical protein
MTLPPDFWDSPQPGGSAVGLIVGLFIGVAAWCYFVLPAYRKTKYPSFENWSLAALLAPLMIGGGILGAVISYLVAFEFGH